MKVIHLSDLHLGYEFPGGGSTFSHFERIIERLKFLKEPNEEYAVVITGDTVDDANTNGLYEQAEDMIRKLDSFRKVLIVPGNHDYGTGSFGKKKFVNKFKKVFYGNPDVTYPKLDIVTFPKNHAGVVNSVAFIGLDSTAEELHWYDAIFAEGELGKKQLSGLKALLNTKQVQKCAKRVVYLHHHPFHPYFGHQLKDAQALQDVLDNQKVDALLFGHNHAGDNFNGKLGIPRCYDGGSSTRKMKKRSSLRVMNLEKDPREDYIMEIITDFDLS